MAALKLFLSTSQECMSLHEFQGCDAYPRVKTTVHSSLYRAVMETKTITRYCH